MTEGNNIIIWCKPSKVEKRALFSSWQPAHGTKTLTLSMTFSQPRSQIPKMSTIWASDGSIFTEKRIVLVYLPSLRNLDHRLQVQGFTQDGGLRFNCSLRDGTPQTIRSQVFNRQPLRLQGQNQGKQQRKAKNQRIRGQHQLEGGRPLLRGQQKYEPK